MCIRTDFVRWKASTSILFKCQSMTRRLIFNCDRNKCESKWRNQSKSFRWRFDLIQHEQRVSVWCIDCKVHATKRMNHDDDNNDDDSNSNKCMRVYINKIYNIYKWIPYHLFRYQVLCRSKRVFLIESNRIQYSNNYYQSTIEIGNGKIFNNIVTNREFDLVKMKIRKRWWIKQTNTKKNERKREGETVPKPRKKCWPSSRRYGKRIKF